MRLPQISAKGGAGALAAHGKEENQRCLHVGVRVEVQWKLNDGGALLS